MKSKSCLLSAFSIVLAACAGDEVSSVDDGEVDLSPLQNAVVELSSSSEMTSSSSEESSSSSQESSSSVEVNPLYVGYDYLWLNRVDPLWNECNDLNLGKKAYLKVDNLKLICRYDENLKQWLWTVDMSGTASRVPESSSSVVGSSSSAESSSSIEIVENSSSSSLSVNDGDVIEYFGSFTDSRDGTVYQTVFVDTVEWMGANLSYSYGNGVDTSYCYEDRLFNCMKYGRLYKWNVASRVCPEGWRLPSNQDWSALFAYVARVFPWQDAAEILKSSKLWDGNNANGNNLMGMSFVPAGAMDVTNVYLYLGSSAFFWTSEEYSDSKAFYYYLNGEKSSFSYTYSEKDIAISVRCVRTKE